MDRGFGLGDSACRLHPDVAANGAAFLVFNDLGQGTRLCTGATSAVLIWSRESFEGLSRPGGGVGLGPGPAPGNHQLSRVGQFASTKSNTAPTSKERRANRAESFLRPGDLDLDC